MDELLPKALPVDAVDDPDGGKWDIPAQSAASYLKMVRQEASKCPDVVIANNIDSGKFRDSQTYFINSDNPAKAPSGLEPSIQWQIKQILEFSKLREKISKMKETFEKTRENTPKFPPDMTDGQRWVVWCCGKDVLVENQCDEDDDEDDDDDDDEIELKALPKDSLSGILCQLNDNPVSTKQQLAPVAKIDVGQGNPPLVSIAMYMNQPMVETVLKHHVNYIQNQGFHMQQGPWIYAMLSMLQKPLAPDTCALLRDLARLCSQLRSRLDSDTHPHLRPFNLFISLVARYFDQRDMADDLGPNNVCLEAGK